MNEQIQQNQMMHTQNYCHESSIRQWIILLLATLLFSVTMTAVHAQPPGITIVSPQNADEQNAEGQSNNQSPALVIGVDSAIYQNADKSLARALAYSAVLPGMGEGYLGEHGRKHAFIWADAMFWGTTLVAWLVGEHYMSTAQDHAVRYAGAQNPPDDLDYLQLMADYTSRSGVAGVGGSPDDDENYNQTLLRSGQEVDVQYPNTPRYSWDWGSSGNPENQIRQQEYSDLLRSYRTSRIVFQAAAGALLLNRIISMVDVLQIYRNTGMKGFAVHFVPWTPGFRPGTQALVRF